MNDRRAIFEFGPYRLEGRERRLSKSGEPVVLPPKVFDTLLLLVENAGHVLTKSELMASLWPGTAVEEGNLTKNIWLIRKALGEAEEENRYIETVPKAGYRFVAPVRTVTLAAPALSPTALPDPPAVPAAGSDSARDSRTGRRRWAVPVIVIAILTFASGVVWMAGRGARSRAKTPAPAVPTAYRRTAVVLEFRNLSGRPEAAWLSTAVSEMVSAEIGAGEELRLIPAENVARIVGRSPAPAGPLSRETLGKLRSALDVDLVISGSYVAIPSSNGERLRFDALLQDAATAEVLATVTETGNESDLFDRISSAGRELRSRLGLGPVSSSEPEGVAAAIPRERDAARFYAEGLAKLRADDALGARPLLEASIRSAPAFGPAHEALSLVWSALGYDQNARDEAEKSFRLASAGPAALRLSAEARLAETEKDWARAESLEASIFRSHRDDPEAGLRLASTQVAGGRAKEALGTLAALAALRAPVRDDPRIDLARAGALAALSRWPDELAASRAAATKGQRSGSIHVLAEGRLHESDALMNLGKYPEAKTSYSQAADLFRRDGDVNGEAEALIGIANVTVDLGQGADAEQLYRQAQATFERTGNRRGEAHALSDLANLDWARGDVDAALLGARQVLAINREVNDQRGVVWGLAATGNILADQGRFDEALALQREGVGLSRKIGDQEYLAYSLGSIADTFLAQGRLEDARRNYEEALAIARKVGDAEEEATHENDLGNVFAQKGEVAEADRHYARALARRRSLGDADEIAQSQMLIGALRNSQGRYSEAARLAGEAARAYESLRRTANGAIALATQARAETGLGKLSEARAHCDRARALLKENRQNGANLPVLVEAIRVETAAANLDAAARLLADFDRRAQKAGWPFYVLEARRAAAEIDIRRGRTEAGFRRLRAVSEDARNQGFNLIVMEAQNALGRSLNAVRPR